MELTEKILLENKTHDSERRNFSTIDGVEYRWAYHRGYDIIVIESPKKEEIFLDK